MMQFSCSFRSRRRPAIRYGMPRKPNYNFEKQQKERAREQKRNAKAEEKRLRKLAEKDSAARDEAQNPDAPPGEP